MLVSIIISLSLIIALERLSRPFGSLNQGKNVIPTEHYGNQMYGKNGRG